MAAVTFIAAVLLLHLTGPVTAIPCSDELTWKKSHAYKKLNFPSVRKCAAECVASPVCASLNFDMETKTCNLYGTAPPDVVSGNLEHWTKTYSGIKRAILSQVKMCGIQSKVYSIYIRDCGEPPDVPGSVKVTKYQPLPSVTTYTCQPDFISCDKKPDKTSRCQPSGLWEKVSMRCEQFRLNKNIPWDIYYVPCGPSRNIQISISGTQTTSTKLTIDVQHNHDIILHVKFSFDVPPKTSNLVINTRIHQNWGSPSDMNSSLKVGQASQIFITMDSGTYKVKLNGTNLHTRREPKKGIEANRLFVSPSLKIRELMFRRLD